MEVVVCNCAYDDSDVGVLYYDLVAWRDHAAGKYVGIALTCTGLWFARAFAHQLGTVMGVNCTFQLSNSHAC